MNGTVGNDCRRRPKTVWTEEEESQLNGYLVKMSEMAFGFTRKCVMGLAFSIVEKSKRPHPFQYGSASRARDDGFMLIKPKLTIRSPQPLSYCRALFQQIETQSWTSSVVFKESSTLLQNQCKYNYDETGFQAQES